MQACASDRIDRLTTLFREGDPNAAKELIDLLYPELRRMAATQMRHERPGHTWQPTALVNELYLELVKIKSYRIFDDSRSEKDAFLRLSAHVMKRLLIHHARPLHRRTPKVPLDELSASVTPSEASAAEVEAALSRLEHINPRLRAVVELRVFEGLTADEIAARLGCGSATVTRDWALARRWLSQAL